MLNQLKIQYPEVYAKVIQNKDGIKSLANEQKKYNEELDRTITLNATSIGGAGTEQIKPEAFLQHENKLVARTRLDPRTSSNNTDNAINNILVTNIRNSGDEVIYRETAGPRSGRGTIYEVATVDPEGNIIP